MLLLLLLLLSDSAALEKRVAGAQIYESQCTPPMTPGLIRVNQAHASQLNVQRYSDKV